MILLARQAERHLRANYQPDGLNMGINIGKAGGRGRGRTHPHARAAALGGGRQFHDIGGRDARAAGGSGDDVREALAGLGRDPESVVHCVTG